MPQRRVELLLSNDAAHPYAILGQNTGHGGLAGSQPQLGVLLEL